MKEYFVYNGTRFPIVHNYNWMVGSQVPIKEDGETVGILWPNPDYVFTSAEDIEKAGCRVTRRKKR